MELQGRDLRVRMKGEDVKVLHSELSQLGFMIPSAEIEKQFFGSVTSEVVKDFQNRHGLETTGVVDEETARLINAEVDALHPPPPPEPGPEPARFIVRGKIRKVDGSPLDDGRYIVMASDKDLRSEQPLGEPVNYTATAEEKRYEINYEIAYTADQFRRAEKKSADLIVRVLGADGSMQVESPIIFNAPQVATVDLIIGGGEYRGPSEYEQLVEELTLLLEDITVKGIERPTLIDKIADLREDEEEDVEKGKFKDISFLVGETGIDPQRIVFLVLAARLSKETELPTDGHYIARPPVSYAIPAEAFYGLFRQNLPTSLPTLISQSPQVLRRALEASLNDNIIPARLRSDLDRIMARLQELIVEHAFKKPEMTGRHSLSELLGTAAIPQICKENFLRSMLNTKDRLKISGRRCA